MKALIIFLLLTGIAWGGCWKVVESEEEWEETYGQFIAETDHAELNAAGFIFSAPTEEVTCVIQCIDWRDTYCNKWRLSKKECPNIEIVE